MHSVTAHSAPRYSSPWYPDSGATHHVTPDLSQLHIHEDYAGSDRMRVADVAGIPIKHVGSSTVFANSRTFQLNHILHVPAMTKNLLSVRRFCADNNAKFEFTASGFTVKDQATQTPILSGTTHNGLYVFPSPPPSALHVGRPVIQHRSSRLMEIIV